MPRKPAREIVLQSSLDSAVRQALVEHVLENPELTLAELVGLEGELGTLAASMTVGELRGGASTRKPATRRQATSRSANGVDTRTPAGRAAYGEAVLKVLKAKKKELSAADVRAECGGTELQARTALHRLVKGRKVKRTGKARASRYAAK